MQARAHEKIPLVYNFAIDILLHFQFSFFENENIQLPTDISLNQNFETFYLESFISNFNFNIVDT